MKQDWVALGSIVFLVIVFAVSFFLLQRTIRRAAQRKDHVNPNQSKRILSDEERMQIERRLQREALRQQREAERVRQQEAYEAAKPSAYADKIRKREEQRMIREADELRSREEKERRDATEYDKWKSQIEVTDNGEDEEDNGGLIQQLIHCLGGNQIQLLEDIASRFNLSIQQIVDRVRDLEQQGAITGCLDDRGRYIPISLDFMDRVDRQLRTCSERIPASGIQSCINSALAEQYASPLK